MSLLQEQAHHLQFLLNHLASTRQQVRQDWQGWVITPLSGGGNNQLFRAQHAVGDFAVKFMIRDERNRAEHEFQALSALEEAGLHIAPRPLLLDHDSYHQPVVVQTWIEGELVTQPPAVDEEWKELLHYYRVIHSVTPGTCSLKLPKAYGADTVAEGRSLVNRQLARIPGEEQAAALKDLVRRFERAKMSEWEKAPIALCRIDPNVTNFIRRADGLASVDWEYSGWSDPAFDLADLMAHPAYMDVPTERWTWIVRVYSGLVDDPTVAMRIETYYRILMVWWTARSARFLYETARGINNRLASLPDDWEARTRMQYEHYLKLAVEALTLSSGA